MISITVHSSLLWNDTEPIGHALCTTFYWIGGKNNAYYEKKNSPLAQVYTGRSILESHHTALLIQFVNDPRFNLLGNMDPKVKSAFKELLIEAVLGTDMAKHTKMLGKFKKRVAATLNPSTATGSDDVIQAENSNDRRVSCLF